MLSNNISCFEACKSLEAHALRWPTLAQPGLEVGILAGPDVRLELLHGVRGLENGLGFFVVDVDGRS